MSITLTLTSAQIAKLNKMNKAAQGVSLGTILNRVNAVHGTHTITGSAAQTISTGLSGITGITATYIRASDNAVLSNYMLTGTSASGGATLTGGSVTMASGDKLHYIVW